MFAQEFCFYNFKRYSTKTNTFHYNSLLPLQRIADTWMSVKVPYVSFNAVREIKFSRKFPNLQYLLPDLNPSFSVIILFTLSHRVRLMSFIYNHCPALCEGNTTIVYPSQILRQYFSPRVAALSSHKGNICSTV